MLLTVLFSCVQSIRAQQAVDAVEGLDPVLLVQGKEVQGELTISVTRGGFRYLFANQANKTAFEQDPARYEIQLGGACARMGAPVRGLADLYAVHQGRLYIFGSEQCKTLFVAAPEKYLPPAKVASPATPEALKKGAALLERAIGAAGGASKIDGLRSYQEKSVMTQSRGQRGEVEVKQDWLVAFPDRTRLEIVMPDFNDAAVQMRMTNVLASEPFLISRSGKVLPLDAPQRADLEQQLQRKPLFLLRARAGLKASYSGTGKVGDTPVELVTVELAGMPATLSLDSASGRLLRLSYQRRGPQGEYGEFAQTYSDFRTVDGVTLPFKLSATFAEKPWKDQSFTVESLTFNKAIDAKLFEKPTQTP